jgi:aspartate aminotransferase
VISDEIYEKLIYDNLRHTSIASFGKDIYDLTITVNGLSKSHSMTGWRIGFLGGPQDIVNAVSNLQDHSTSNPASISQKAACAALSAPDDFSGNMRVEFEKRRDYAVKRLSGMKKMGYALPEGAFYIFCDIKKSGLDSMTFADRALDEASVAVIPGLPFGWNNYVRISFASDIEQLGKAMDRIEGWLSKI